jgi:hypothetical protein
MYRFNNKKKNNSIVTAATFLTLATILVVSSVSIPFAAAPLVSLQSAEAQRFIDRESQLATDTKAPSVVSGDNIYIAWWTNNTENGNEEVMFRASTDGGETFGDRINLSNSSDADSWRVEIAGEGDTVVVSWWETNQTSDIPVARISTDAGETFGPMIMLGTNGTIGSGTEEGEGGEGETVVEEEVEEAAAGEGGG